MDAVSVLEGAFDELSIPHSPVLEDATTVTYPSAVYFGLGYDFEEDPSGAFSPGRPVYQIELRHRPGIDNYRWLLDKSNELGYALRRTGKLVAYSIDSDNGFQAGVPSTVGQADALLVRICIATLDV